MGTKYLFEEMKKFKRQMVEMVVQQCECTKMPLGYRLENG